jgi:hypothetical protein
MYHTCLHEFSIASGSSLGSKTRQTKNVNVFNLKIDQTEFAPGFFKKLNDGHSV